MNKFIDMITEPVATNKVLPVVLFVIMCLVALCLWNLNGLIRAKKKRERVELEKASIVKAPNSESLESYESRLECSKKLVSAIDFMVTEEIASVLFTYNTLGQEYPIIKMDEDIKMMSESVYKGLESNCVSNVNNIFTSEYIIKIINRSVANTFIEVVRTYNKQLHDNIRQTQMDSEPPED